MVKLIKILSTGVSHYAKDCGFFLSVLLYATAFGQPINQLVFLGDSLSDNGNLYHTLLKVLPKSPPYYKGRFSNGFTWAEQVGTAYYKKYYADYHIYAVGGATAILHNPITDPFIAPATLEEQLYIYLSHSLFTDKKNTLFSIWIGGNDYFFDKEPNLEKLTNTVVSKITWTIETLINQGGHYFLILNLPNLAEVPFAKEMGSIERLQTITDLHNEKLNMAVNQIKSNHPDVKIIFIDVNSTLSDLLAHPDKYNAKYHTNITNTVDACWKGSVFLANSKQLLANRLAGEFKEAYIETHHTLNKNFNAEVLANNILNSPDLSIAYGTQDAYQKHLSPCANADEYVFWDQLHPTAIIHQILAQIVLQTLDEALANN